MVEGRAVRASAPFRAPDEELLTLESEALRVKVWPRMGGKIVSLIARGHGARSGHDDVELLHLPIHAYNAASETSGFELSDAGGWDECLPSVSACNIKGLAIPDHGDIWRTPWAATVKHDSILARATASSMPLRFSRWMSLDGPTMHLRYAVTNTGDRSVDFLWSAHPLFQVQQGDRIVLPDSVKSVEVEGSSVPELNAAGTCSWPIAELAEGHFDLGIVGACDGITSHKLFAGPLTTGWCGLYRTQLKIGIVMRFDPGKTPFAGLWISQGAWPPSPENGGGAKQYTVALEPTTAPCDGLDRALALGHAQHLLPQAELSWPIQFEVFGSHGPIWYEEFLRLATIPPRY